MLNWQYIKGFYQNTGNELYTFIHFKDTGATGEDLLPDIYTNTSNELPSTSMGHVVTTGVSNTFSVKQTFNKYSDFKEGLSINNDTASFSITDSYAQIWFKTTTLTGFKIKNDNYTFLTISGTDTQNRTINFYGDSVIIHAPTKVGNSNESYPLNVYGTATISSACNAEYFNATSDLRAKENLKTPTCSMLDLIDKMSIYTFNYKSDPKERNLGIIAQDVQDIDIDGFSLVDNKEATGQNDDYMSVRESKLIYVLLGAVKELKAEVASLKAQLNKKDL